MYSCNLFGLSSWLTLMPTYFPWRSDCTLSLYFQLIVCIRLLFAERPPLIFDRLNLLMVPRYWSQHSSPAIDHGFVVFLPSLLNPTRFVVVLITRKHSLHQIRHFIWKIHRLYKITIRETIKIEMIKKHTIFWNFFFLKRELTLSLFIVFLERKQIDRLRQTDRNTLIDACFLQKKNEVQSTF